MLEDADPDPLLLAVERYGNVRKYAPMFLQAFTFCSARRHDPLLAPLDMLKLPSRNGRRALRARFPVGPLREQKRKLISGQDKSDRRLYEIAALAVLRDRLRSVDVWVEGSRSYRPMDELLMPMPAFSTLEEDGDLGLGVQTEGAAYLSEAAQVLDFNLKQLTYGAPIANLTAPAVEVPDLLKEVHEWTRCTDQFTHVRTGEPPRNISAMLAGALADGTNLGPKHANSIKGHQRSPDQLDAVVSCPCQNI